MPEKHMRLLQNRQGRSGVALGSGCAIVFGLPFLAVGVVVMVLGILYSPVKIDGDKLPIFVPLAFGGTFAAVGLFICAHGVQGLRRKSRQRRFAEMHLDEPWFADYPWDMTGITDNAARKVIRAFLIAAFLFVFLVPFNYAVFVAKADEAPLFAKIIVGIFDVLMPGVLGRALYCLARYLKYGSASLRFKSFPFFLGERLEAQFVPPGEVRDCRSINITLRCIEERFETDSDNSNVVRCYEIYADTVLVEGDAAGASYPAVPIAFDLPDDAPSTALAERPPVYWEIEIKANVPGIDYRTNLLVPVYARPDRGERTP